MLATDTVVQQRYRIVRLLGQGGMGAVYQALDMRLGNSVALKQTLSSDTVSQQAEAYRRAFEREARILANLRHPALPKVFDYFADESGQFLVMEFIEGDDLPQLLSRRGGPLQLEEALRLADQLLSALDYLHTQAPPIIHRDIKPQNIKLTARGDLILLDFGLAKGMPLADSSTSRSLFAYTLRYAPIEQIQGSGTDARSDLYACAATLYYLLTGRAPADAVARTASLLSHQPDPLVPVDSLQPQVPATVAGVLGQALALDMAQRPASAAAMRDALRAALDALHQPPQPSPAGPYLVQRAAPAALHQAPTVPQPSTARRARGATTVALAGAALALLLVAAIVAIAALPSWWGAAPTADVLPTSAAAPSAPAAAEATAPPPSALPSAAPQRFAVGQVALTRMPGTHRLWTDASGGQPLNERPRLLGGAQVTILELEANAVRVRTAEGAEGWIQAPAARTITADAHATGPDSRFAPGAEVRVVWSRGIPLRAEPRSTATKTHETLNPGDGGRVLEVRGDWLRIELGDGAAGWARWYYDNQIYIELADLSSAPPLMRPLLLQPARISGADVSLAQARLILWGYLPGPADGIYGPESEQAVRRFQSNNQLEVDGVVGPQTWARLFSFVATPLEEG